MVSETDDLEQELRRNLKLRRELGDELRLELLTTDAAATAEQDDPDDRHSLANRLVRTAWIAVGLVGLALAALFRRAVCFTAGTPA